MEAVSSFFSIEISFKKLSIIFSKKKILLFFINKRKKLFKFLGAFIISQILFKSKKSYRY
jgi:hypothetical protein